MSRYPSGSSAHPSDTNRSPPNSNRSGSHSDQFSGSPQSHRQQSQYYEVSRPWGQENDSPAVSEALRYRYPSSQSHNTASQHSSQLHQQRQPQPHQQYQPQQHQQYQQYQQYPPQPQHSSSLSAPHQSNTRLSASNLQAQQPDYHPATALSRWANSNPSDDPYNSVRYVRYGNDSYDYRST